MQTQMDRLEQAGRWLDEVAKLPLGHPDRLRFLTIAEQIIAGSPPVGRRTEPRPPRADAGHK